ncbi:MAG: hypothetical protein ACE1ZU_08260, partial [bacterium]
YPWQTSSLQMARWVAQHTPPGTRLAGFNVGILSYVSGRTAINLDGSVNNQLLPWVRRRKLWSYCERHGVRFLVASEEVFRTVYRQTWGPEPAELPLVEVARFYRPGLASAELPVIVYKVQGSRLGGKSGP